MFVLPPPARYPTQAAFSQGVAGGQVAPLIETANILSHPSGSEYQLLAGEGTYVLSDDLHLATPLPHSSEAQLSNLNPLATSPQPPRAGTKLSLLSFGSRSVAPLLNRAGTKSSIPPGGIQWSIQEHPHEGRVSIEASSGGSDGGEASASSSAKGSSSAPAFAEGNLVHSGIPKDAGKRRKPKNNITKSSSSFISRCVVNENITKRLLERSEDGYFAFANINRAFQWLDLGSSSKAEFLTKILFTKGHCLCHDINQATKNPSHVDLIMGFSTGEIIWYEPISQKYTRLNKNGIINATPVCEIRWIPGSENLFLAAHMDGSLIVYDKERDDTAFLSEEAGAGETNEGASSKPLSEGSTTIRIEKSIHSKNQKFNPIAYWKLSNQRINACAFSPDNRHIAVVSEDGTMRIVDYFKEQLLGLYSSYYGGFLCVCWSPDGKYVLTGGQDDLVSIWSVEDSVVVARCQGHQSWVTAVSFDAWRCDDRNYRFGSVGEDCRLLLWDFSVGMLHRPKATSLRQRASITSRYMNPLQRAETQTTSTSRLRSNSDVSIDDCAEPTIEHPVQPKATTATLPPILSKVIDPDPLCWLEFTESSVITSCKSGHIRTWGRPPDVTSIVPPVDAAGTAMI